MNLPLRIIFVSIFISGLSFGQIKKDTVKEKSDTAKVKTSVSAAKRQKNLEKNKNLNKEVITAKAISDTGILTVHKVEDKYYFEIPDTALKKEFLLVTRLTKAAAGMRSGSTGYAGMILVKI
jgi:hypothetical protein